MLSTELCYNSWPQSSLVAAIAVAFLENIGQIARIATDRRTIAKIDFRSQLYQKLGHGLPTAVVAFSGCFLKGKSKNDPKTRKIRKYCS